MANDWLHFVQIYLFVSHDLSQFQMLISLFFWQQTDKWVVFETFKIISFTLDTKPWGAQEILRFVSCKILVYFYSTLI